MDLISEDNLNAYLNDLADELKWDLANHKSIYQAVLRRQSIDQALQTLEARVFSWFIRNGEINPNWQILVKDAVRDLQKLDYDLPDLIDDNKMDNIVDILGPLGKIKMTKSGNENYMPVSKLLTFFFPNLIPKIDTFWVKDVCLRKINNNGSFQKRFRISGLTNLDDYRSYLELGAHQSFDPEVLGELEDILEIESPYGVAFEYCLLGHCKEEILAKKCKG